MTITIFFAFSKYVFYFFHWNLADRNKWLLEILDRFLIIWTPFWFISVFESTAYSKFVKLQIFPLAFVAGSLQVRWWGFIRRNYVVRPIFFLMNVYIALKGTHICICFLFFFFFFCIRYVILWLLAYLVKELHIWAISWQNQQCGCAPSEDSDLPGHPPSLISLRCVLNWGAKEPRFLHADSEDWSDWVDSQADLSLRWAHKPFCWFCHEKAQIFSVLPGKCTGASISQIQNAIDIQMPTDSLNLIQSA